MKFKTILATVLSCIVFWSCNNSSSNASTDATETSDKALVSEVKEHLLTTPDLTLLEVKGNVKEIKELLAGESRTIAKFDENGKITHFGKSDPIDKVSHEKRDNEGRLTNFLADTWTTVAWNSERPASIVSQLNEETVTETFKYNNDGQISEIKERFEFFGEEPEAFTVTISYPADAFDANGNWVKRICKYPGNTETQCREIIYY